MELLAAHLAELTGQWQPQLAAVGVNIAPSCLGINALAPLKRRTAGHHLVIHCHKHHHWAETKIFVFSSFSSLKNEETIKSFQLDAESLLLCTNILIFSPQTRYPGL